MKKNLSIILGAFCSIFFVILIEPNSLCVTDGEIIKIVENDKLKSFLFIGTPYRFCKFIINYSARDGKETTELSPIKIRTWSRVAEYQLPSRLQEDWRKVFFGDTSHRWKPYVGCKVKVYYLRGAWFGDKSWLDPLADISMCQKPPLQKYKQ